MKEDLVLHEVGMRDGLQIEKTIVPTDQKIAWMEALAAAGVDMIQVGSFVHKEKVPQMADTDDIFTRVSAGGVDVGNVTLTALVLNEKGLERGSHAASATSWPALRKRHAQAARHGNDDDELFARYRHCEGGASGRRRRPALRAVSLRCGFEGVVPEERVLAIGGATWTGRPGDQPGRHGRACTPAQVTACSRPSGRWTEVEMACHFHDTYGSEWRTRGPPWRPASSTSRRLLRSRRCPFTAKSGGNVCTEDFVHMLQLMGRRKDVKLDRLIALAGDAARFFGRDMTGKVWKTGPVPVAGTGA